MLKKIALGGFFLLASAVTFSASATAVRPRSNAATVSVPRPPIAQGICPGGRC
jgi:hypothetical protein